MTLHLSLPTVCQPLPANTSFFIEVCKRSLCLQRSPGNPTFLPPVIRDLRARISESTLSRCYFFGWERLFSPLEETHMSQPLKSGLDSESQFVLGESREEFAQLQSESFRHYQPRTPEERFQVDNLVRNEWL